MGSCLGSPDGVDVSRSSTHPYPGHKSTYYRASRVDVLNRSPIKSYSTRRPRPDSRLPPDAAQGRIKDVRRGL